MRVSASVVLYCTPADEVRHIIRLLTACPLLAEIHIIDNSPKPAWQQGDFPESVRYHVSGTNLGYGAGHNVALRQLLGRSDLHLISNSDIDFVPGTIERLVAVMQQRPWLGLVGPHVRFESGETQRLCKLLPHPLDVFGRRFFPRARWARRRSAAYELADFDYARPANIPFLSGCFMLVRVAALEEVGLFDERYFLYAEDLDLCRRIHARFATRFEPSATITHYWRRVSHHTLTGTLASVRSHAQYFNKWGWLRDPERAAVNRRALAGLGLS